MDFKNLQINNTVLAKANLNLIYFYHPPAKAGGNSIIPLALAKLLTT